uniref:NADH dehydrogenase subunit 2 n=1 Tax=Amblyomma maculatum TaxID=34609 RepID=UPI002239090D|nr:NADH dehydrogenase subunit 2 [Amblyomma maculatum]UYB77937.1 NADH dehydrogenase subunit 2 [Amblyomma maculatum]
MFFKNLMKWLILITIIISFSSNSWFIFWLMMELNLLMFMPLMSNKKKNSSNSMISYFIIQSFSSSLFIMSALYMYMYNQISFQIIMIIAMLMKLAVIPFHFWLTSLSELIEFSSLCIILTLQKMIPLLILFNIQMNFIIMFIIFSAIFSSIFAINSKTIKKILIFSSISHQSWIMTLMIAKSNFWIIYMLVYSLIIFKITSILEYWNVNTISKFLNQNKNFHTKLSIMMMMFSLGGMPPFMGFLIKLISILILIKNCNFILMLLIVSSMINIYFYIQLASPTFFLNYFSFKNFLINKFNFKNILLNINLMILILIMNSMTF